MSSDQPQDYSKLRTNERIDLSRAIPLSGPFTVYLEPTNICNFKCTFCPESFPDYKTITGGEFKLDLDTFARVAAQIKAFGTVKTLNFYMMGEPFANKNVLQFIALAKREAIAERVIVTSNGTLIKPNLYSDIVDSQLDYLRVSIYGGSEELHKQRTKTKIPLATIRRNVSGLKQHRDERGLHRPFIYVKMIESPQADENASFLREFTGVGDELRLEPIMNWNDPEQGNLAGQSANDLLSTEYFARKKEACAFPFYTLVIHSDLRVSVCCVDWDKKTSVGSLATQTLQEIWNGPALREFQLKHLQHRRKELEGCRNCTFLHTAPDNIDALSAEEFTARLAAP